MEQQLGTFKLTCEPRNPKFAALSDGQICVNRGPEVNVTFSIRISPPAGCNTRNPEVACSWSSSPQPNTVACQRTTPPATHSRKPVQALSEQRSPPVVKNKRVRPKRGPRSARNLKSRTRSCSRYKSRSRSPRRRSRRPRSRPRARSRCTSRSPRRRRSRSRTDRRRPSLKRKTRRRSQTRSPIPAPRHTSAKPSQVTEKGRDTITPRRRSLTNLSIWRGPFSKSIVGPFDSLQVSHTKRRVIPVITIDGQLTGSGACTVEDVQQVLVHHPSQQPSGAAVTSVQRTANPSQPIQLYPARTQEDKARKQEQDLSKSPLPTSPDPPVEIEPGNPSDPPEPPRRRSSQDSDRPGCQAGQEEEAAQPASNCAESILQERIYTSAQECRLQSLRDSGRLSNKKAACSSSIGGGTTSSPPVAAPRLPTQDPAQSKVLPDCIVGSEDFSVTSEPVNALPDSSFPQTQSVPSTSIQRTSGSRDKETQQLLDLLKSCMPAIVRKNKSSFQK